MVKVIGIGDNVCDCYEHLGLMFPGGQALNFSVYAKMLGAEASYMGVFGTDEVAAHVISTLDQLEVDHKRCRQLKGENGCARVTLQSGDRIFLGSNKGGVARKYPLELTTEDLDYIRSFDLIHTSNNSYINSQLPKLYKTGIPVSYDLSARWADEELVKAVAPYASFVFLSCGAVTEKESREICLRLHGKGCGFIAATMGSEGALVYDGRNFYRQAPHLVDAVDTLGAGDSFATAFLLSFTESRLKNLEQMNKNTEYYKEELKKAMEKGAAFAADTCLVQGAFGHEKAYKNKIKEVTL